MHDLIAALLNNPDNKTHVLKVNVGDYVNLTRWLKDVWAEVIAVHNNPTDPDMSSVLVITYGSRGKTRKLEHVLFKQLQQVSKSMPSRGFLFERCRYVNYYTNQNHTWPVDIYPLPTYASQFI